MKIFIYLSFLLLFSVSYAKEWTIMVYINGDNNLDEYAFGDFNELETVGSNDTFDIVVQYDRFQANSQANWSGAKRYHIIRDNDLSVINSDETADLGEVDSGDYNTVVNFVRWAKDNYPAQNYALIIWNHGSGWQKKSFTDVFNKAVSIDDTDGGQISIANGDYENMLSQIKEIIGKKLDFLGLDACLMGMWEVAFSSEKYAKYIAFSEETENATGWEYHTLLNSFLQTDKTPLSFCKKVVETSIDSVGSTLSCIDLSHIPSLTRNLNNFAQHFLTDHSIDLEILTAYGNTIGMESEPNYKDFGMFFNNLIVNVDDDIKINWLAPVINDYYNAVVLSKGIDNALEYTKTTGFTIYMGLGNNFNDGERELYENSSWSNQTLWDDFIKREFFLNPDSYEPDDTFETAYYNQTKETTSHSIHSNDDVDYSKLSLKKDYFYKFKTICGDYDTYMVLFDENGTTIQENDDKNGRCSQIDYFSDKEQTVYLEVYSYAHESVAVYDLVIEETRKEDDYGNDIDEVKDGDVLVDGISGAINYVNDVDVLYFNANDNTEYAVETINDGLDDTIIFIYDDEGNLIDENDDIDTNAKNYMSKIVFTSDKSGKFFLFIKAYEDKTGGYKIKFTQKSLCSPTNNGVEICDGIDNDCDGEIDNNLTPPDAEKNIGVCLGSKKICKGADGWIEPDYFKIQNYEDEETLCDGLDNNCDGIVDNIDNPPLNINQKGVCKGSTKICTSEGWKESYENIENYSSTDDNNDKLDNNCDGQIDESYKPQSGCDFGRRTSNGVYYFFMFLFMFFVRRIFMRN